MLDDALSRLVDNAVRFTKAGSVRVNVELKRRELSPYPAADVEIAVADTGIGIPAERQELVFTPFYQVDSASTRTVGGTGLGLAIARRLAEAMGGSIALESRLGAGTTVRLRLPTEICRDHRRAWRTSRPAAQTPALQTRALHGSVLLVEDNEFNAALVVELLTLMGLDATHAVDGEQAHRLFCGHRFDAILMDCQMPNVDGYESTRRIRATENESGALRVPIIALTANALSGDRQKCLGAGMDDYLAKPYTAGQLHAKLSAWLPKSVATNVGAPGALQPAEPPSRASTSAR